MLRYHIPVNSFNNNCQFWNFQYFLIFPFLLLRGIVENWKKNRWPFMWIIYPTFFNQDIIKEVQWSPFRLIYSPDVPMEWFSDKMERLGLVLLFAFPSVKLVPTQWVEYSSKKPFLFSSSSPSTSSVWGWEIV